jgi:hypothetical protein
VKFRKSILDKITLLNVLRTGRVTIQKESAFYQTLIALLIRFILKILPVRQTQLAEKTNLLLHLFSLQYLLNIVGQTLLALVS